MSNLSISSHCSVDRINFKFYFPDSDDHNPQNYPALQLRILCFLYLSNNSCFENMCCLMPPQYPIFAHLYFHSVVHTLISLHIDNNYIWSHKTNTRLFPKTASPLITLPIALLTVSKNVLRSHTLHNHHKQLSSCRNHPKNVSILLFYHTTNKTVCTHFLHTM